MDFSILEIVQENILQALGIFSGVVITLKSFAKNVLNLTNTIKDKVDKVDLEEVRGEIKEIKETFSEIIELEEIKAKYSLTLNSLPSEVKDEIKKTLEKYSKWYYE